MGIGSGVVHDSDPLDEWRECLLKGQFLSNPAPAFELIETLLWQPEKGYRLLDYHIERLTASAAYFDFYADRGEIADRLAKQATTFTSPQRVRLTLDKDGTARLAASPCEPPAFYEDIPPSRSNGEESPLACFASRPTDPQDRFLYHKTTRRGLYDQERKRATDRGYFEVLFCNERGEVTEGAITNIFIRQGDVLFTPPVECGLLNGVLRRFLLERGTVQEKILRPRDLAKADGIYLGNSVRGLVQVRLAPPRSWRDTTAIVWPAS